MSDFSSVRPVDTDIYTALLENGVHRAARYVSKNRDKIRTEKVIETMANNRIRGLRKETRTIKKEYNANLGNVYGCNVNDDITSIWW